MSATGMDPVTAYMQDMSACANCPHPEGCPMDARECDQGPEPIELESDRRVRARPVPSISPGEMFLVWAGAIAATIVFWTLVAWLVFT